MGTLASQVLLQTEEGLGASGFDPVVQNLGRMVWKDLGWLECCHKNLSERRWCPRPTVSPACCAVAWCKVPVPPLRLMPLGGLSTLPHLALLLGALHSPHLV